MAHQGYYTNPSNLENINDALLDVEADANRAEAAANGALVSETNAANSAAQANATANGIIGYVNDAMASATSALGNATIAGNHATNASNSASAAATSANNAATSATNAANSASASSSSATAAASSATEASNVLSTSLLKASNLSDLQSVTVAKTNLGLNNVDNTSDANKPISTAQAAGLVAKDSSTGSAQLPAGTTAQRSPNGVGKLRYNTELGFAEVNNGSSWGQLGGDTLGPSSSTDNALVRFNSTTGKLVKNSSAILNDSGELSVSALQVGQSNTSSNNFHWRNLLDGLLRLSRGNSGSPITDVMRVKADNSVEFPGGVADGVLGAGQTLVDVTASRSLGTTFVNTDPVPRYVSFLATSTVAFLPQLIINGVTKSGAYASSGYYYAGVDGIVPPGGTYLMTISHGTGTLFRCWELRK